MPYKLTYTAHLQQVVNGVLAGDVYTFSGSQTIVTDSPASSDFTNASNAMATDIAAQATAQFPVQSTDDSSQESSGQG